MENKHGQCKNTHDFFEFKMVLSRLQQWRTDVLGHGGPFCKVHLHQIAFLARFFRLSGSFDLEYIKKTPHLR